MARLVLSQNERLILHLWQLDKYRDEPEVPIGASQEGISQRLQTQVHNVSRALASLGSEGLVYDRLVHIRGAPKRRKAYFLTERGAKAANAIREDVGRRLVVLEHLGKTTEMTLNEVLRRIEESCSRPPDFLDLAEEAMENDVIRLGAFAKPTAPRPERVSHFVKSYGRPVVSSFYGRASELEAIVDMLSRDGTSVVLIWGIPGIGKSTLASKVFDSLSGKHSMLWYACREWDSESTILPVVFEFLLSTGLSGVSTGVSTGTPVDQLFSALCEDMSSASLLLFFDDVQKLSGRTSSLLSMIVEAARVSGRSKVILISRTVPMFFSGTASGSLSMELRGLDRDSAWQLARDLEAAEPITVVERSKGNPLLLSLMARSSSGQAAVDVNSFIEREVCASLSGPEIALLKQLSVFRHPVPASALSGSDVGAVSKLKGGALIYEQEQGLWTHDLLREFFASRSSPEEKKQMHRLAAAYCSSRTGAEWRLEHLHHLVEGADWDGAVRMAVEGAQELAKEFPDETVDLLNRMSLETATADQLAELLFIRAQLRASTGDTEASLADFETILSRMSEESETPRKALVLEAVARLQSEVERWSESIASHKKALQIHERSNDRLGQAREWMAMGGIYRRKRDFGSARDAYSKALGLYSREEDRAGQAACLNNMALLDWDEGHLGDSERRFRESVRLAHSVKDHVGEATGLENLAELARAQFRFDESINLLLDSAESFRRAGELSDFKRVQARRAEALSSQGRHAEGIQTCVDVLDSPEFRKKQGLFQKSKRYDDGDIALSSALVGIHRRMGDLKKGQKELSRYIEMATTLRDPSRLAMGRLMESDVHEDLGDLPSAAKALEDAERILRGSGDLKGLLTVQIRRGVVEEMLGNEAKAVSYYRDAVRNADILGDREAMAHSFENLGFALGSTTKEGMKFLRKAMDLFDELNKRADFERIRRALGD